MRVVGERHYERLDSPDLFLATNLQSFDLSPQVMSNVSVTRSAISDNLGTAALLF